MEKHRRMEKVAAALAHAIVEAEKAKKKNKKMVEELSGLTEQFTKDVCTLADKYGRGRNEIVYMTAQVLTDSVVEGVLDTLDLETMNFTDREEK